MGILVGVTTFAVLRAGLGEVLTGAFLGGLGEFDGLIELNKSLACLLAKRLCRCMFIRVLKSWRSSSGSTTTLAFGVIEAPEAAVTVLSLAGRTVVNFDDLEVVAGVEVAVVELL